MSGCKPVYRAVPFDKYTPSNEPNYSNPKFWAVKPDKYPDALKKIIGENKNKNCDVFFIYPTAFLDRKDLRWNADLSDKLLNESILKGSIKYKASAFARAGNIYVPFYRQSHYKVFVSPYNKYYKNSIEIAYSDVREAFKYYLENFNNGKPIIIASHSQGSLHAKRLIQEFFDNKPLQDKLVGAYLIGTSIKENEFKNIKSMNYSFETGGFVSWNSYKYGKFPKKYDSWFKGGVTSNPITWNNEEEGIIYHHKGLLYEDKKIYSQSVSVKVIDGLLWTTLPKVPKRFLMSFIKNYHFADINLFWKDIEENSILRVKNWLKEYKK